MAKIQTMRQSQQAAQAEEASGEWGPKLRASDDTLTRDIQKLRAAERSALSLFSSPRNAGLDARMRADKDAMTSEFFGRLNLAVSRRLCEPSVKDQIKRRLGLAPLDLSEIDQNLIRSPTSRLMLQKFLNGDSIG